MSSNRISVPIKNREVAGQSLAEALQSYQGRKDLLVLALPRGGVPVAYEVARQLAAPLDLMLVRKLGTPGHKELAMGAIASGGYRVINDHIVSSMGISDEAIEREAEEEQVEMERRETTYRGDRPRPEVKGKQVILVDDGVATGATIRAAIVALRKQDPAGVIVAVPVAPPDTVEKLRQEADEVICPATPEPFNAIGAWYVEFPQVSDSEVQEFLGKAWRKG